MTEKDIRDDSTIAVLSASQVLPLVRRRLFFEFAQGAAVIGMLSFLFYSLDGNVTTILYVAPFLLLVPGLQMYAGRYIPISNKHDSLLRKYGDVYIKEVSVAVTNLGIRELLRTRWFESYADEFCKRHIES